MPHRPRTDSFTIAASGTASGSFSMQGTRDLAIDIPTFDTATKWRLQYSNDGGTTFKDLKDTTGTVLEYASSTGGHGADADYLARFYMYPLLRIALSTAQVGAVTFKVYRGREAL